MESIEKICENRKAEILSATSQPLNPGAVYYVSAAGDDASDGLSPDSAWRTLEKVTHAPLKAGDNVLFRRGDLFRGCFRAQSGVFYGAFGEGEKPRFYSFDYDLADENLWEIFDAEKHIWRCVRPLPDCGTLVFNEGEYHSRKLIPSFIGGRFVCREDEKRPFDVRQEMTRDLDLFCACLGEMTMKPSKGQDFPIPNLTENSCGALYLRCDRGNPGRVFRSIEALARRHMITVGTCDNVRIDNLCLKYIGMHAVRGSRQVHSLHVTNCEIGWVGGCIQHYLGTDPNYPEGGRGTVTRFGNGVEIYGGCDDFLVENCYIYQVYDAGITHQITTGGRTIEMKNVLYKDNLVEKCVYSIEYFLDMNNGDVDSTMDGIEMCGNILREAGYGWGQQRHNKHTPAHIKGWSYVNRAKNYSVHDNIFDRSAYRLVHLVAKEDASCPAMARNVYVQHKGGMLGQYGGNAVAEPPIHLFDENVESTIRDVFGESDAVVAMIE